MQAKILSLLRTLTISELTQLSKFLKSPYHNNSQLLIQLFEAIKPYHPKYESKSLKRERLFMKLFSNEDYHHKKISDLLSDLNLLVEKFLMIETLKNSSLTQAVLKIQMFEERNLERHFSLQINKSINTLIEKAQKTAFDYYNLLNLYFKQYFHLPTRRLDKKRPEIQLAMDNLDQFFILMKLRLGMEIFSRKGILSEEERSWQLKEVLDGAEKYKNENPLFYLFPKSLRLLQGNLTKEELTQMVKLIQSDKVSIPDSELRVIIIFMTNKLLQIYYSGKESFIFLLFDTYKAGIQKGNIFIENGEMRNSTFANIVVTACIIKEFKWVKQFIQNHAPKLPKEGKTITMIYCQAILSFHQKEFEKVLEILRAAQQTQGVFELRVHFLKTRVLYELYLKDDSYHTTLNSNILSSLNALNKIKFFKEERKNLYRETINWIKRLKRLKYKKISKEKKDEILEELNQAQLLAKVWLQEKIEQL